MPDYKADLQTNNTNLRTVLSTVQNLSSGSGSSTETWTLAMADGSTKTEQVSTAEVVPVYYHLPSVVTSSNNATFVRIEDTYETTLSSGTSDKYIDYDSVVVYSSYGNKNEGYSWEEEFYPDEIKPWLVNISVPANRFPFGDDVGSPLISISIWATLSSSSVGDWDDWEEEGV